MRLLLATLSAAGLLLVPFSASAAARPHHHSLTHALMRRTTSSRAHHVSTEHTAYAGISSERAAEIQAALIRQGYLTGDPTGTWDSASTAAMQKLQSDNGWQTRIVPDSRALIKLGLGPNSNPTPSALAGLTMPASN